MIMTKARLVRSRGSQGTLAKVLTAGAAEDRSHGLVWALFNHGAETSREFLYREIEPGAYLIVSASTPSDPHGLWHLESKTDYDPVLEAGDRLGFVLRANPVVTVPRPGQKRGLRADPIMHAKSKLSPAQRKAFTSDEVGRVGVDWLASRGASNGFDLDTSATSAGGYVQVRIAPKRGEQAIQFSQIDISGVLTVRDPALLQVALAKGIGKARAFGCGLMLIRRAT